MIPAAATTTALARRSLSAFVGRGTPEALGGETGGVAEATWPMPELVDPLPVFTVDVGKASPGLESAQQTGWRYLVVEAEAVGAVDIAEAGGSAELVADTSVAERLGRTARYAEDIARTANPDIDYEARLLDLNLIGNSLFWLASPENPQADLFFDYGDEPALVTRDEAQRRIAEGIRVKLASWSNTSEEAGG